jgi:hypothetical protein
MQRQQDGPWQVQVWLRTCVHACELLPPLNLYGSHWGSTDSLMMMDWAGSRGAASRSAAAHIRARHGAAAPQH